MRQIFAVLAFLLGALTTEVAAQAPTSNQVTRELEYRQLHPDARKLIVEEIRITLQSQLLERFGFYARIFGGAVGLATLIFAAIGWRGFRNFRENTQLEMLKFIQTDPRFSSDLRREIERAVTQSASATYEKARREYNLGRLELSAKEVQSRKSFTNAERDMLVELLTDVGDDPEVRKSKTFSLTLRNVVHSFAQADLDHFVDLLDDKFRETMSGSMDLVQILVQDYGMRALGGQGNDQKSIERFNAYLRASERCKIPEIGIPYKMVFVHSTGGAGADREIARLFKEVKYWDDDEIKTFCRVLFRKGDPSRAGKFKTAKQEEEYDKFVAFMKKHEPQLSELRAKVKFDAGADDDEENDEEATTGISNRELLGALMRMKADGNGRSGP